MSDSPKGISFKSASAEELERMVWRGKMVAEMRANEFFKNHIVPAMSKRIEEFRDGLEWMPGATKPDIESIALDRVWKSALTRGAKTLSDVMNDMLYEATKAQTEIDERAAKAQG